MQDPNLLLSYINTLLRDRYQTFDDLIDDLNLKKDEIMALLSSIGYQYKKELNQFVPYE